MRNQKKAKVWANITDDLNATSNISRAVDIVGKKNTHTHTHTHRRLELKCNVVFKVPDYLEEFTAWTSETLKQFCVVIRIK